jgi:hypothetical protein
MSTLKLDTLSNKAGTASVPSDTIVSGTAKAWVSFDGTGTIAIRRAFNVSTITDNGTGDYTANFSTAFADANYAMTSSSANTVPTMSIASPQLAATPFTTTTARVQTRNTTSGGLLDCQFVLLSFFS